MASLFLDGEAWQHRRGAGMEAEEEEEVEEGSRSALKALMAGQRDYLS